MIKSLKEMKVEKIKKYLILSLILAFVFTPLFVIGVNHANALDIAPGNDYVDSSGEAGNNSDSSGEAGNNPDSSGDSGGGALFDNPIKVNSIAGLVYALLKALVRIGWIFVVLALIYSGFSFVMASGNPDKISKAKVAFFWTIIGGVVLLGSMAISEVVCNTAQKFDPEIKCIINVNDIDNNTL